MSTTKQRVLIAMIATAGLLAVAGCPGFLPYIQLGDGTAALKRFASAEQLLDFLKGQISARQLNANRLNWALGGAAPTSADAVAGDGDVANQESSADDYSSTNIQETGVDEGDIVKTDGTHLFIARENALHIVKAVPADQMSEIGRVELDVGIIEFYLNGSDAIVLGAVHGLVPLYDCVTWPPFFPQRTLSITQIDITNPGLPHSDRTGRAGWLARILPADRRAACRRPGNRTRDTG